MLWLWTAVLYCTNPMHMMRIAKRPFGIDAMIRDICLQKCEIGLKLLRGELRSQLGDQGRRGMVSDVSQATFRRSGRSTTPTCTDRRLGLPTQTVSTHDPELRQGWQENARLTKLPVKPACSMTAIVCYKGLECRTLLDMYPWSVTERDINLR